jgi:hypothetical protein
MADEGTTHWLCTGCGRGTWSRDPSHRDGCPPLDEPVSACPLCGALVAGDSRRLHAEWHHPED